MALFYVDPVENPNRSQSISDFDGDGKNDYTVWQGLPALGSVFSAAAFLRRIPFSGARQATFL